MSTSASKFKISILFGAGGSRTIPAAGGATMALHLINLVGPDQIEIDWYGGISGGAPIAAMVAVLPWSQVVDYAIETDYQSFLTWHGSYLRIVSAFFQQKVYEETRPCRGVLNPEKLRIFLDRLIGNYPKRFWTMSVSGNSQIVFTSYGVYEIYSNGTWDRLSDAPPSVGTSIIASCAVPGIIDAVSLYGRYLFDGALSKYGACPVDIATFYMKIPAEELLAVDVGDDFDNDRQSHNAWNALFGVKKNKKKTKVEPANKVIMVRPDITGFCALQFVVPAHQKWQALMISFFETLDRLEERGMVNAQVRARADLIKSQLAEIANEKPEEFVRDLKILLASHGLYEDLSGETGENKRITADQIPTPIRQKRIFRIEAIEKLKSSVSQVGLRVGRWFSDRFSR